MGPSEKEDIQKSDSCIHNMPYGILNIFLFKNYFSKQELIFLILEDNLYFNINIKKKKNFNYIFINY
jgi:dTDP-glucose pyrophosphorylase